MTTVELRSCIHELIDQIEDEEFLKGIHHLLTSNSATPVNWEQLSDAEKKGIEEGLKDAKEGRFITHEQMKKRNKKWFQ